MPREHMRRAATWEEHTQPCRVRQVARPARPASAPPKRDAAGACPRTCCGLPAAARQLRRQMPTAARQIVTAPRSRAVACNRSRPFSPRVPGVQLGLPVVRYNPSPQCLEINISRRRRMLWAPRLIASCCFASTLPRDPRMSVTAESLVVALSLGSVVSRMRTTSSAVCKLPHLRLTLVCILPVATGRLRKREPLLRRRWRHPSPMLPRSDVRSARDDARRCARLGAFPAQGLRPHERAAARHRLHAGAASRAADGRHAGSPLRSHFALCISRGAGHT